MKGRVDLCRFLVSLFMLFFGKLSRGDDIRLVNGFSESSGRVEVFSEGVWKTVCDEQWDLTDATVACRQLGYKFAISSYNNAFFGEGTGDIGMEKIRCKGHEDSLSECEEGEYIEEQVCFEPPSTSRPMTPRSTTPRSTIPRTTIPRTTTRKLTTLRPKTTGQTTVRRTVRNRPNTNADRADCSTCQTFCFECLSACPVTGRKRRKRRHKRQCTINLQRVHVCDHDKDVGVLCGDEGDLDCTIRMPIVFIAVFLIGGILLILAMTASFLMLHRIRKGRSAKEESQSCGAALRDIPKRVNDEYMDLQEINQPSSKRINLDVPFQNLESLVAISGNGFMDYNRANLILASKSEEVVMKRVSDDAPVRLAKLQADEVESLSKLTSNTNVIRFIGRCNRVPNLLCYEFVKGTNLSEYLRENFQQSKIHQYRNTKGKLFHVPEKGSLARLPLFGLQIASGMKFLTSQKFVHPGLRAEKVIIDVSGQCKLYDFVSEENGTEIFAILWSKSVPYQWMPPEYLFLQKFGPSVDVWSFGVLIWEIYSYGDLPHIGKDRNSVERELREKRHLPLPNNCPGAIWQLAQNCWNHTPEKRPSFENIAIQLAVMCDDNQEYDEIQMPEA